nr:BnaC01g19090D [Ipomoea batatas]GMD36922.1 BnaC01g19090D [Ipomoea batatas]
MFSSALLLTVIQELSLQSDMVSGFEHNALIKNARRRNCFQFLILFAGIIELLEKWVCEELLRRPSFSGVSSEAVFKEVFGLVGEEAGNRRRLAGKRYCVEECCRFKVEKIRCSLCKNSDFESSTDLTAKISPDCRQVATDTAAEEPWPMVLPLIQLILDVEKTFLVFGSLWQKNPLLYRDREIYNVAKVFGFLTKNIEI